MAAIQRFEDIEAWRTARDLTRRLCLGRWVEAASAGLAPVGRALLYRIGKPLHTKENGVPIFCRRLP